MKVTVGTKIGSGFAVLILLTVVVFILTTVTINSSKKINHTINSVYTPSVEALQDLNILVVRSKLLIYNWVFIQSGNDNLDKIHLKNLIETDYPIQKERILKLAENWSEKDRNQIDSLIQAIDQLFNLYKNNIISQITSFESYEDAMVMFMVRPLLEGGEVDVLANDIINQLTVLINSQKEKSNKVNKEMVSSFNTLELIVRNLGILLVIGGILIAFFTTQTIVKPINTLKSMILTMSKGVIPKDKIKIRSDEIGEMAVAFDRLIDAYKRQIEFSKEVGAGNFEADYEPLGKRDMLGFVLLRMRDDIKETERILENKVKERTAEVVRQKAALESAHKKITESINYAQRIQNALLPETEYIKKFFPQSFRFYKAKDVVSGDFPWFYKKDNYLYIAAVDCTGHGVPGALISIIGHFLLNEIISSHTKALTPAEVLNVLHDKFRKTLKQDQANTETRDGMDIALCRVNLDKNELLHSGAHRPLLMTRDNHDELLEFPAARAAIGGKYELKTPFVDNTISLQKNDTVYFFSDGLVDQFGGPTGRKKFSSKRVRELVMKHKDKDIKDIYQDIVKDFNDWVGDTRQIDDVLLISIRF